MAIEELSRQRRNFCTQKMKSKWNRKHAFLLNNLTTPVVRRYSYVEDDIDFNLVEPNDDENMIQ